MRRFPWPIVAALPLTVALSSSAKAVEIDAVRINVVAAVTEGPGTGARVGTALAGDVYAIVSRTSDHVQIQLSRRSGWVRRSELTLADARVHAVTADVLNVRAGAGTRFGVLGQLDRSTRVALVGPADGPWNKIFFNGRAAWVHGAYLTDRPGAGPAPAPAPAPAAPAPRRTSRAGYIQLPAAGPGFATYGAASRRWGRPALVYGIERAGQRMRARGRPRIGVGDISLENGGNISGHASHERGVDVDVRPMRNDGREGRVTRFERTYSRDLTRELIQELRAQIPTRLVLFNDLRVGGVLPWPGHDNHFHFRMR
jgi:hypothetical protein